MELGGAIRRIDLAFRREGDKMLEKYGLTVAQMHLMLFLFCRADEGKKVIQRDIEEGLKLTNPTVSGTLDRLEKNGFVRRLPDPENRRMNRIVLTEKAMDMKQESRSTMDEFKQKLVVTLSSEEQEELDRLLNRIIENLPQ